MSTGDWTLLSLWIHIPLVIAWIGLVIYDVLVSLAPGLSDAQRGRMVAWSRPFVLISIVVIMATGIWQTWHNPIGPEVTSYDTLEELRDKTYGLALFWKHIFVLTTFVLTIAVRFVVAPRIAAVPPTTGAAAGVLEREQTMLWLSLLNLAACLMALIFATRMVWELH